MRENVSGNINCINSVLKSIIMSLKDKKKTTYAQTQYESLKFCNLLSIILLDLFS